MHKRKDNAGDFSAGSHIQDAMLVMALDGELNSHQAAMVRSHLEACWSCRVRMETVDQAIADVVDYRDALIKPHLPLPSGPRALSHARLQELAANLGRSSLRHRLLEKLTGMAYSAGFPRRFWAAAVSLLLVIAFLMRIGFPPPVAAGEMLRRAEASQARSLRSVQDPVIYPKVRVRYKNLVITRPVFHNTSSNHCTHEITNGGVIIFNSNENFGAYNGRLSRLRSNCDFDFRHSLNGSYIYELPFHAASGWLNQIVSQWQVSGTIFSPDGFPSVFSAPAGGFVNAGPPLFANKVSGQSPYSTKNIPNVTTSGTMQWLNPYAFQSVIDPTTGGGSCYPSSTPANCQDGNSGRNNYRSPNFVWSDFSITKRFPLTESVKLRMDLQAFNVFNHPNFGLPNGTYGAGNANPGIPNNIGTLSGFGTISNTVGPATSLVGSNLGGDSSVRMVALHVGIEF
jgi:hypothetical protein